jgi:hypothetical protein
VLRSCGFLVETPVLTAAVKAIPRRFTVVLAGLEALLEHQLVLNLVADHHPDAHEKAGA